MFDSIPLTSFISDYISPTNLGTLLYTLLTLLSILSLYSPPFPHRRPLFSLTISLLLLLAQFYPPFPDTNRRFSLGMLWYLYLSVLEKLLFASPSPESTYWHLDHPRAEALAFKPWGWAKLRWALALSINMRGIGWNFLVKGVPPLVKPHETRRQFLLRQSRNLVLDFLTLDACSFFIRSWHGMEKNELELAEWMGLVAAMGCQSFFANQFQFFWLSIFGVGTGLSEPKDWPPMFGDVRKVTTLRYFWGSFWHQGIRKILSGFTHFFLRVLRVPRHTPLSSVLTLFFTFGLSGLYHGYAAYALPMQGSILDRFGRYMVFFLMQPFGIMLEDMAIRFYRAYVSRYKGEDKKDHESWKSVIGYVWVFCWAMLSGNVLLDAYLKTEMGLVGSEPTIIEPIFKALQKTGFLGSVFLKSR